MKQIFQQTQQKQTEIKNSKLNRAMKSTNKEIKKKKMLKTLIRKQFIVSKVSYICYPPVKENNIFRYSQVGEIFTNELFSFSFSFFFTTKIEFAELRNILCSANQLRSISD